MYRGVTVGVCAGLFFGVLAWLDSGMLVAGATVFIVVGLGSGVWMARRMARSWPGARTLTGAQRVEVAAAARRGERIGDDALAPAVVDYSRALQAEAEKYRPLRWVIGFILIVAVAAAAWDAVLGSLGNVVVSLAYLLLIVLDLIWWPKRRNELLTNAHCALVKARQIGISD